MRPSDHPAKRPTRYHWAAGLNPWHWVPALGAWLAVLMLGATAMAFGDSMRPALAAVPLLSILALGWSGLWLIAMPAMPRFRRLTDAKLREQYENDYDYQNAELYDRIHPDLRGHVQDLSTLRDKARALLEQKFGDTDPFAKDNLSKLDKLAIGQLKMLAALTEYDNYVNLVDPDSIGRDLEAARLATRQEPGLGELGQKQIELLENRLERYQRAKEKMRIIHVQIKNVETTMKLLLDQAMTAADPQRVGRDIDMVLRNIKDSEILSQELSTYDDLERELDDRRLSELS